MQQTLENNTTVGSNIPAYIPTPEEIEAACSEIQSSWSEEEFIRRRRVVRPSPYQKKVYHLNLPRDLESAA